MALQQSINYTITHTNDRLSLDDGFKQAFNEIAATITQNIVVQVAYHCVEQLSSVKNKLTFTLVTYKDASKNCILYQNKYTCDADVSSAQTPNFYVQAYEYLKRLDEFADVIDV